MTPAMSGATAPGDSDSSPELSICVVIWNSESVIRDCLQSVYSDARSVGWEVFVVDNASTDSGPTIVQQEFPQVTLLQPGGNLGFSRANNLALQQTSGDFQLLLNPDTQPRLGALGQLIDFMRQRADVGIVGPRLVGADGRLELSCGRSPTMLSEIGRKLLLHRVFPFFRFANWDHQTTRSVGWVTGACLMIRRAASTQVGYLDGRIFMCLEDVDWCMRVREGGWDVTYFPASEVVHIGGSSIRANFTQMLVISQQSLFYLFFKHFGPIHVQVLRVFTLIEMVLRAVIWSVLSALPSRRLEAKQRLPAYFLILRKTAAERSYYHPQDQKGASDDGNE
jgi:N-acetylglucosaminyl-diphospho-decaprenol L-rhamnosyltransferase